MPEQNNETPLFSKEEFLECFSHVKRYDGFNHLDRYEAYEPAMLIAAGKLDQLIKQKLQQKQPSEGGAEQPPYYRV